MSITSESWWGREIVPAALNALFRRCCDHFHSDPMGGGTKGNAAHTYGRHRSIEWSLNSAYCTDRSYGTRDRRDLDGNHQHIRAMDVKLAAAQMREVSHRLDAAVRAGHAPMVAEWFGTFDNQTVVGWYEGHPSSADSSHLEHVHVGVWTKYANDTAALDTLFAIMTGDDMALTDADCNKLIDMLLKRVVASQVLGQSKAVENWWKDGEQAERQAKAATDAVAALDAKVDAVAAELAEIKAALSALGGGPLELKFEGTAVSTTTPPQG